MGISLFVSTFLGVLPLLLVTPWYAVESPPARIVVFSQAPDASDQPTVVKVAVAKAIGSSVPS